MLMANGPVFLRARAAPTVLATMAAAALTTLVCTSPVDPPPLPPVIVPMADTSMAVYDSVVLHVTRADAEQGTLRYYWRFDGDTLARDTTFDTALRAAWGVADTGRRQVCVQARSTNGTSTTACFHIIVHLYRPVVALPLDTTIQINRPLSITVAGSDTNGRIVAWHWVSDSGAPRITTVPRLTLRWGPADTGMHSLRISAIDDDSIESTPVTMHITVLLGAPKVTAMADTAVDVNDTVTLHASASDSGGSITAFVWLRGDSVTGDTTAVGEWRTVFRRFDIGARALRVIAVDNDTIASRADSFVVTVRARPPAVAAMADTMVDINDTVTLHASASDSNGWVRAFIWLWGDSASGDTTAVGTLQRVFHRSDTGTHALRVVAVDDDTMASPADSFVITVRARPPSIKGMADTTVSINDSVTLHAGASDSNGVVVRYLWALNGVTYADTTPAGTLATVFRRNAVGAHVVRVLAVDDDTLKSTPDSFHVTVVALPPQLLPQADTIVPEGDTLRFGVRAVALHGRIVRYYLGLAASGWSDSSADPQFSIADTQLQPLTVRVGCLSSDTLFTADTFLATFNRRPTAVRLLAPADTVVFWSGDSLYARRRVRFHLSADDPNGPQDTLTFRVEVGPRPDSLRTAFLGRDSLTGIDGLDTGWHYCRLTVYDRLGDSATRADSFVCLLEKRICFVGHSVVEGAAGDNLHGGFRKTIIDSLRSRTGSFGRVRAIGDLVSGWLLPASDDSSIARSRLTAHQVHDSLLACPWANADYWVQMTGVNGNYNYSEQTYTRAIMDTIYRRNPAGELYVLNGLPLPDTLSVPPTISDLYYFNSLLASIVDVRRNAGRSVFLVDAFALTSVDSVFNDTLFADYLHPNQTGYERLAGGIWQKMISH
jgi:hypothetical protein